MPERIQRKRTKGWMMPPNTVCVTRPGRWGNPFKVGVMKFYVNDDDPGDRLVIHPSTIDECVAAFRWLVSQKNRADVIRKELRGKNLACFCPLDQPCHADVLLEIANS